MKWKDYWDCPEEIFIGAMLQFPLYFIIHWWVLPVMAACGLLWRLGGTEGGWKPTRWALVPLLVCTSAYFMTNKPYVLIAAPFMVKFMPFSYGKSGWLYKWLKDDFLVRIAGYAWYWLMFVIAYTLQ
jgi:hypothetical protein